MSNPLYLPTLCVIMFLAGLLLTSFLWTPILKLVRPINIICTVLLQILGGYLLSQVIVVTTALSSLTPPNLAFLIGMLVSFVAYAVSESQLPFRQVLVWAVITILIVALAGLEAFWELHRLFPPHVFPREVIF